MRFLTLPPLVVLLLLVFLWFILLVLLLWFALRPRRNTHRKTRETPLKVQKKTSPSKENSPAPTRRPVVVHQLPPKAAKDEARDDAFDGYTHPANRRDDFDF